VQYARWAKGGADRFSFSSIRKELRLIGQIAVKFVKSFEYDTEPDHPANYWRDGAKAVLEFIRNVAVVSAIKFFATRAESVPLHIVAEIGKFAISVTVASYASRINFVGWAGIENPTLQSFLTVVYSTLPAILAYFILGAFISHVTDEIVRSQMIH
jgi:hypothetical protein